MKCDLHETKFSEVKVGDIVDCEGEICLKIDPVSRYGDFTDEEITFNIYNGINLEFTTLVQIEDSAIVRVLNCVLKEV